MSPRPPDSPSDPPDALAERTSAAGRGEDAIDRALGCYEELGAAQVEPLGRGLINQTYRVRSARGDFVLQRLNPIFDPVIHHNMVAVTERLAQAGLETPLLLRSRAGSPWVDLGAAGNWRLMTFITGTSFDVVQSPAQARGAAVLVGRFHRALEGLAHHFAGMRVGVHDTPKHLATLRAAMASERGHRLHAEVSLVGQQILRAAAALPRLPAMALQLGHGDLKLNNLLFAGPSAPESDRARCLIDLDTVGPMDLAYELGDAWRSWCNRGGESAAQAELDLPIFEASWDGYQAGLGRGLGTETRRGLLHGLEWVSLELSARFAADGLLERYFGWDPQRFPGRGEHNLLRAQSQLALHLAAVRCRDERAQILGLR